jgi:hypothetical protein
MGSGADAYRIAHGFGDDVNELHRGTHLGAGCLLFSPICNYMGGWSVSDQDLDLVEMPLRHTSTRERRREEKMAACRNNRRMGEKSKDRVISSDLHRPFNSPLGLEGIILIFGCSACRATLWCSEGLPTYMKNPDWGGGVTHSLIRKSETVRKKGRKGESARRRERDGIIEHIVRAVHSAGMQREKRVTLLRPHTDSD